MQAWADLIEAGSKFVSWDKLSSVGCDVIEAKHVLCKYQGASDAFDLLNNAVLDWDAVSPKIQGRMRYFAGQATE